jgi:hypothetical protein
VTSSHTSTERLSRGLPVNVCVFANMLALNVIQRGHEVSVVGCSLHIADVASCGAGIAPDRQAHPRRESAVESVPTDLDGLSLVAARGLPWARRLTQPPASIAGIALSRTSKDSWDRQTEAVLAVHTLSVPRTQGGSPR